MKPLLSATLLLLVLGGVTGTLLASRGEREPAAPATPSALPSDAIEILEARPFVLDEPYAHEWRAEAPLVRAGYALVLRVPAELAETRATFEPVLFAGQETVERVNAPRVGQNLVVVVPAPERDGRVQLDLERTALWFGSLELPERLDAARIAAEARAAEARGIGPARRGPKVRSLGADQTLRLANRRELDAYLADWVEFYSPEETDLVRQLRPR